MNRQQRRAQEAKGRNHVRSVPMVSVTSLLIQFRTEPQRALERLIDQLADASLTLSRDKNPEIYKTSVEKRLEQYRDPHLLQAVVSMGWHNVTLENVEQELCNAGVARSLAKENVAYILSVMDGIAVHNLALFLERPERGQELQEFIIASGIAERETDAEIWPVLCKTMIDLEWRGVNDEGSAKRVMHRAVAERIVALLKKGHLEDVIGKELQRNCPPREREAVYARFKARLNAEWNALPHRHDKPLRNAVDDTFVAYDRALEKVRTERISLDRVDQEVQNAENEVGLPLLRDDTLGLPFDERLAVWGHRLWDAAENVAQKHPDEDYDSICRALISTLQTAKSTSLPAVTLMFAAVWAVEAFQRITTTHTFAAALMCSDPDATSLQTLEKQWRAFLVILPNGILNLYDEQGVATMALTRILVAVDDANAKMTLHYDWLLGHSCDEPPNLFSTYQEDSLSELLMKPLQRRASQELRGLDKSEERAHSMVQRLVAGLLLAMQTKENFTERVGKGTIRKGKRQGAPEHRHIHVGRPLAIDLREQVTKYLKHGNSKKGHGPPTVQVLVRGHYKRQPHGEKRLLRKVIWIEPFWRGPEEALISVRAKKLQA